MHFRAYLYLVAVAPFALAVVYFAVRHADALTRKSSRRTKIEMFVLAAILLICVAATLRNQIMGVGRTTLAFRKSSSDTNNQYIPFYLNLIRCAKAGSFPLWYGNFGMGASILSNQSWALDPFNLVLVPLCLVRGEGFLSQALAITFACRAVVASLLFSHLLTRFCETPIARIFGAVTYGFGGYLFTEGQHYFFGTAWVFLPLLLITLEYLMNEPKGRSFLLTCLVTAALVCFSAYLAFIVLLFVPIYVALRLIAICADEGPKCYFQRLGLCALGVLGGVLLAGVLLIPTAYYLAVETARVGGEYASSVRNPMRALTSVLTPHEIMLLLSRMLGNGLISIGSDYRFIELGGLGELEFFQGGFSCAVFVLLGQFVHWAVTETKRAQKVAVLLGALLVTFYCLSYFPASILTTFRYPTYRGCLLINAVLVCAMSIAFERRLVDRKPSLLLLGASLLVTVGVLAWSWKHTVNAKLDCAFYALAVVALVVFLFRLASAPKTKHGPAASPALAVLVCAVAISTVIADSFFTISLNPKNVSPKKFPLTALSDTGSDMVEALSYLDETDPSYHRTESTFTYWSRWNEALTFGFDSITSYNASEDGDQTEFFHQLWPEAVAHETNNFSCYSYKSNVNNPQMMSLTGIRYVVSKKALKHSWAELLTKTDQGIYIYKVNYGDEEISPLYLRPSLLSEAEARAMSLEERRAILDTTLIIDDEAAAELQSLGDAKVSSTVALREEADGSITGTIEASGDAYACLAIPDTLGWTVLIDGKTVPTFRANFGLIGFRVPAGSHAFSASYRPAMLPQGAVTSAAGVIIALVGALLAHRMTASRGAIARKQGTNPDAAPEAVVAD